VRLGASALLSRAFYTGVAQPRSATERLGDLETYLVCREQSIVRGDGAGCPVARYTALVGYACVTACLCHSSSPIIAYCGRTIMRLDDHFGSSSTVQRNERVKLAASFWNNVGAGMVFGGMAGAFFLERPPGAWPKIGIAVAGLVLGWICYSIASNILTYLHTTPEQRR
jgi:hypothetical protein